MELKKHYNNLWRDSLAKIKDEQVQFDNFINSPDDTRYGLTLLARPSEKVKHNITTALKKLKQIAPHQYYYPESDLHITILSIISCYPKFSLTRITPSEYCNVVHSNLKYIAPFKIRFRGLTASPSCVMIQGFPEDNQLNNLRNKLRKDFKNSGLEHSIDKRYHIQTAHITAVRFKQQFTDLKKFIDNLVNLKDIDLGSCIIQELELSGNNWYMQRGKVQLIKKFSLTNNC